MRVCGIFEVEAGGNRTVLLGALLTHRALSDNRVITSVEALISTPFELTISEMSVCELLPEQAKSKLKHKLITIMYLASFII